MTPRWQISAGEITEWLPPLLFAFASLASAWVLHDARRRRFAPYAVAAWVLTTLIYAPVVLPAYLVARMFKPPLAGVADDAIAATPQTNVSPETEHAGTNETDAPDAVKIDAGETVEQVASGASPQTTDAERRTRAPFSLKSYVLPLAYACALLLAGAVYFYRDYKSFDAHLARAANARLLNRRDAAIREYRAALRLTDDPHTHKLLAIQLAEAGQTEAALTEFRAAERGGELDELLTFRIASALDALGRNVEAEDEFRKFLQGSLCTREPRAAHCEGAAARLGQTTQGGALTR